MIIFNDCFQTITFSYLSKVFIYTIILTLFHIFKWENWKLYAKWFKSSAKVCYYIGQFIWCSIKDKTWEEKTEISIVWDRSWGEVICFTRHRGIFQGLEISYIFLGWRLCLKCTPGEGRFYHIYVFW